MSNLIKSLALRAVSQGVRLPDARLDRVSELTFLRSLLRRLEIDGVLDVGANRGQFAAMASHFRNDRKWSGHQMALGAAASTMTVTVPRLTVMSSLLEAIAPEADARRETVAVERLDKILPVLTRELGCERIFLKMDTQGCDLEVFRGASGCLAQIAGLQSELSITPLYRGMPHYIDALQTYETAGYKLFNLSVVNRVDDGGLLEMNCFMERAS